MYLYWFYKVVTLKLASFSDNNFLKIINLSVWEWQVLTFEHFSDWISDFNNWLISSWSLKFYKNNEKMIGCFLDPYLNILGHLRDIFKLVIRVANYVFTAKWM